MQHLQLVTTQNHKWMASGLRIRYEYFYSTSRSLSPFDLFEITSSQYSRVQCSRSRQQSSTHTHSHARIDVCISRISVAKLYYHSEWLVCALSLSSSLLNHLDLLYSTLL